MPSDTPSYGEKYEILEELGKGGFGRVVKARHSILGRIVALKQLAPGLLASEEDYERFLREARAMDQINHPNIVNVFDAGVEQGFPYIEMAFIEGPDLETIIHNEGALPVDEVVRLGREMASALAHIHEQDIIHRDIKASNILRREEDGQFFLADFGTALQSNLTRITTGVMGSPEYMSPEQINGEVVEQSDIYSLGVVLFEALTGQTPFVRSEGHDAATVELMQQIRHDTAPDVQTLRSDAPGWLAAIIARCLSKMPEARYQSAEALEQALSDQAPGTPKAVGQSRPTQRTHASVAQQADASLTPPTVAKPPAEPVDPAPPVTSSENRPGNKRRLIWGSGILVVVVLLVWGIASQVTGDSSEERPQGVAVADTLSGTDTADPEPEPVEPEPEPEEVTEDTTTTENDSTRPDTTAEVDADSVDTEPPDEAEDLTTPANVEATVDTYLNIGAGDNMASVRAFYANRVDYYDMGRVGQNGVMSDKQNYMERWPERSYERTSAIDLNRLGDDVVQARFEYRFRVANSEEEVEGTGWSLLTFRQEDNRLVIIGEKGNVTSQQ
ncbi:MAG TPA: serine/threonine-protein kinase [Rhodothermales bacterium]|nr:serine/threonine-protein kinase [Rhodothermales bacterium]